MDLPVSYEPLDPAEAGIDAAALEALVERASRDVREGPLPSAQWAIARNGRIVAKSTVGEATDDNRYIIYSCTKGIVGAALMLLIGEGELTVEQRVAELIPEFGENGKEAVTVEQVLTHTSGFPQAPLSHHRREDRIAAMAKTWLAWEPGTRYEYHPVAAHWVLAEIIERLSGEDYRTFIRRRVIDHLGLRSLRVGVPVEEQADILEVRECGEPPTVEEIRALYGVDKIPTSVTNDWLLSLNDPEERALGIPGGGGVSNATDLALFYQALLHNAAGTWKPDVLHEFTANPRNQLPDPTFGFPTNRALNYQLAGGDGKANYRGFGHTNSPGTFGHDGAGGQIAWADPATGISFAWLTNGLDLHSIRAARRKIGIATKAASVVAK
jgi:CubicO group peptidase (beta-lactamase class C family)